MSTRELLRPRRYPPDRTGADPAEFGSEADACDHIWFQIAVLNDHEPVRAVAPEELPPVARDWIEACGWSPPAIYLGNPFVATRSGQSFRIAHVGASYELHLRDHWVPVVGPPVFAADSLTDVVRVLITEIGDRDAPRPFGWPRVRFGIGSASSDRLSALLQATPVDIVNAYRAERGGIPLCVAAESARTDLVTPGLLEEARARGLDAQPTGDGHSITFGYADYLLEISERDASYRLASANEKQNTFDIIAESADLVEIHQEFLRILERQSGY